MSKMNAEVSKMLRAWAKEFRQAAREDRHRWIHHVAFCQGAESMLSPEMTRSLVLQTMRRVTLVLSYRSLDRKVDNKELAWTRRFLDAQRYGLSEEEREARFAVYLLGAQQCVTPIYVNDLADLDFDDLRGSSDYGCILLDHLKGPLSKEGAGAAAQTIHDDLNLDGPADTWWQHKGQQIVIGVEDVPEEEERPEFLEFRGPLITDPD